MPRITEIMEATASDEQRAFLEEEDRAGGVYNTSRIWAHRPGALAGLRAFAGALEDDRTLPSGLVSLVNVRVAQVNGCPF